MEEIGYNNGFENEKKIVAVFDKKKYYELSPFFMKIIKEMFPNIKYDDLLTCSLSNRIIKPDICLRVNGKAKNISIKSGRSDSVHFEDIKSFILFLRSLGVSSETQKTILYYQYGDGTLDGSGKVRLTYDQLFPKINERLQRANDELSNKVLLQSVLERAVFTGINANNPTVDYIYFGDETYGMIGSKYQIMNFVLNKNYKHIRSLHIGPLILQPYLRDPKRKSRNKYKREIIQIKWKYMLTDIQYAINYEDKTFFD